MGLLQTGNTMRQKARSEILHHKPYRYCTRIRYIVLWITKQHLILNTSRFKFIITIILESLQLKSNLSGTVQSRYIVVLVDKETVTFPQCTASNGYFAQVGHVGCDLRCKLHISHLRLKQANPLWLCNLKCKIPTTSDN